VRQLENVCHWLTVMAPTQLIDEKDLPPEVLGEVPSSAKWAETKAPIAYQPPPAAIAAVAPVSAPVEYPGALGAQVYSKSRVDDVPALPASSSAAAPHLGWESDLTSEALVLLAKDKGDVWDALTQRFERQLIQAALSTTRGRRIEAAVKLGIGRNTITRKMADLGMD
jgi:two-component system, NtrC family, nitrogen regulation response regulator GlnG